MISIQAYKRGLADGKIQAQTQEISIQSEQIVENQGQDLVENQDQMEVDGMDEQEAEIPIENEIDFANHDDEWIRQNASTLEDFKYNKTCNLDHVKKVGRKRKEKTERIEVRLEHMLCHHPDIAKKLYEKREVLGIRFVKSLEDKFKVL